MPYCDVHTHLTHEQFRHDYDEVIKRANRNGVAAIVVNGLDPESNRQILQMAHDYECIKPALGIYPVDAINHLLPVDFRYRVSRFDVTTELHFISEQARSGKLMAVGECGLDAHLVDDTTFAAQEDVLRALIGIAMTHDLPIIVHSRKREARVVEIFSEHHVKKAVFHCFTGKLPLAKFAAEEKGWYFSIPAHARRNKTFTKMLQQLPENRVLTETDAPYLAPEPEERNEPAHVVGTVAYWAELKGWSTAQAENQVWQNYVALFSSSNNF